VQPTLFDTYSFSIQHSSTVTGDRAEALTAATAVAQWRVRPG